MRKQSGFTVIELLIAIVVLATLTVFFIVQRGDIEAKARDDQRKIAINAFYYDLTEVFYAKNGYYPRVISRDNLKAVDPALFTDPTKTFTLHGDSCVYTDLNGEQATDGDCDYAYSSSDCNEQGECKAFRLTTSMEKEATFEKSSPKK
ncbi:type II secretion system GspH family protein [Candidatus Saccharibacteria bacterium]|nr:type II secretion system GspH family protein [Candidatus Saccharibacteria bacterium]